MEVAGSLAYLKSGQLDRALYVEVNKALEALGGSWEKKTKAHRFEEDPRDALDQVLLTGGAYLKRRVDEDATLGFFETPLDVARRMVELADLTGVRKHGQALRVLEPSAGKGALAMVAYAHAAAVSCYEIHPGRAEYLRTLGLKVEQVDFLKIAPRAEFDRVLMNPPFRRQADIDHVLHALGFVVPGGRLVSVMGAGVEFRTNSKTVDFKDRLAKAGRVLWEDVEDGAFKDSGTMVRTRLVTVIKDA